MINPELQKLFDEIDKTFIKAREVINDLKEGIELEKKRIEKETEDKKDLKNIDKKTIKNISSQIRIDNKIEELLYKKQMLDIENDSLYYKKINILSRNRLNKYIKDNIPTI